MQLTIVAVGRLRSGPERELIERYRSLLGGLGRSCSLKPLNIIELSEGRAQQPALRQRDEGERLLAASSEAGLRVVLDESGTQMTSQQFSNLLASERDSGTREIAFLIGGADGHADTVKAKAAKTMSLSRLTLPHGLARILLAEQLYRAVTILAGHPYHRS